MSVANITSNFVSGNLVFSNSESGVEVLSLDAANGVRSVPQNRRKRFTIAQINSGAELMPAVPGYKYRMLSAKAVAYGGAVGATTTVDILGTQGASSVKLVAFAQASLTQSTVLTAGVSGAAVLADGASFVACDAGTALTVGKTGSNLTTATGVDIILDYVIEAA